MLNYQRVTKKTSTSANAAQWRCGAATHCVGDGLGASDLEVTATPVQYVSCDSVANVLIGTLAEHQTLPKYRRALNQT